MIQGTSKGKNRIERACLEVLVDSRPPQERPWARGGETSLECSQPTPETRLLAVLVAMCSLSSSPRCVAPAPSAQSVFSHPPPSACSEFLFTSTLTYPMASIIPSALLPLSVRTFSFLCISQFNFQRAKVCDLLCLYLN